jgi:hypothetical protein
MKIIHGPQNIGGMAGVLSSAQRSLGYQAISQCYSSVIFKFQYDELYNRNNVIDYISTLWNYDVFQFYFGESFLGQNLNDIPLLKKLGKKLYFYFCGCDVRDSKITIQKYKYSACKECWPMLCSPNQKKAINYALKYADGIFVSTPDLLEFIPTAELLLQPLDLNTLNLLTHSEVLSGTHYLNEKIIIAHAPTNNNIKGSKYITQVIETLIAENYPIEFVLIQNKPHAEALKICNQADIIIDQLLVGSYGQFSIEMMALGKPVICYIRDDLIFHYPNDLPIINANPETLYDVLKSLILSDKTTLSSIGNKGKEYVSKHHDSKIIANKMIQFYKTGGN